MVLILPKLICSWRQKTNHKLAHNGKFTNTTNLLTLSVSFKVRDEQNLQIRVLCGSVVYFNVARWLNKWKPLYTNHKWPRYFTLIVFLRENELFQRGWGVFVTLVEIPKGWGVISSLQKWKIQEGGGVLSEIPSVVGVWIFSGTTHSLYIQFCTFVRATQIVTRLQVCMPWGLLPGWWLCEKVNMDPWIYIDGNWMLWTGFHFWMERYIDPFFLSLPMLFSLFVHKIWSDVY